MVQDKKKILAVDEEPNMAKNGQLPVASTEKTLEVYPGSTGTSAPVPASG